MKRLVILGLAAVGVRFVATWAITKRADTAGNQLASRGLVLPFRFGSAIETAAVGAAIGWLTK